MQNRVDIKNFIVKIEKDFPVNDWSVNGHHLWPHIRITLFFYLINLVENKTVKIKKKHIVTPKKSIIDKIKIFFFSIVKSMINKCNFHIWHFRLKRKKHLFFGAESHRIDYKESRFNRFFDVLIEKNNWIDNSLIFEYGGSKIKSQYNLQIINTFDSALKGFQVNLFRKKQPQKINLKGYQGFLTYLNQNKGLENFVNRFNEVKFQKWIHKNFITKIAFFKKTLKKISPNKIIILCYYSENLMAMLAAASELGIQETIEMQHGPQTDIHLAYGSWSVIPESGYSTLPKRYWCWDKYSTEAIKKWSNKTIHFKVIMTGNPWVDYWKEIKHKYSHKNYILYSLQPAPISIEQLFTNQIVKLITDSKRQWFIRLHPRQLHQLENIKEYLNAKNILKKVNLNEATNDPLPLLLSNAILHVTHSSGTTLEASYFGLKTILINNIGLNSFQHLIKNNDAIYIDYSDNQFYKKFNSVKELLN